MVTHVLPPAIADGNLTPSHRCRAPVFRARTKQRGNPQHKGHMSPSEAHVRAEVCGARACARRYLESHRLHAGRVPKHCNVTTSEIGQSAQSREIRPHVFLSTEDSADLIGRAGRFELPTPCSRSKCATRLRYAPPDLERRRQEEPTECGLYRRRGRWAASEHPSRWRRLNAGGR